jgi:hypothetical protein
MAFGSGAIHSVARAAGSLVLVRQGREAPTEKEWARFIQLLVHNADPKPKVLIVTDGGGPTPEQRKSIRTALGGRSLRVVVVSDSAKVRFIVSTIALLTSDIRSFTLAELDAAGAYLGLQPEERLRAERMLREMTAELDAG